MKLDQKEIKKLLQKENPIILELGAHKGYDTKRFLNEFKDLKIYCFEPDPRCIQAFKNYINDSRCTLIEAAVTDNNGKTILNLSSGYHPGKLNRLYKVLKALGLIKYLVKGKEEWDLSSSIKTSISNSNKYPWLDFNKKVKVKIIKLDTWTEENNITSIDFIWSDIQGAEREMISGAINTLKFTKYLFTEYGETETYPEAMTRKETIELLESYSFELIPKYSSKTTVGNLLFKNTTIYNFY